jgi:hypothetical protein
LLQKQLNRWYVLHRTNFAFQSAKPWFTLRAIYSKCLKQSELLKRIEHFSLPCDRQEKTHLRASKTYSGSIHLWGSLGNVLLSQNPAVQVPLALEGLTVVFEMGTRGSPPPSLPNEVLHFFSSNLTVKQGYAERASPFKTDNE